MSKQKVAVLGLGLMGAGMAGQLLDKGFEVTVWNRNGAKAAPLVQRGARTAATPAEAVEGAEIVVAMLAQDEASRAVWLGDDGALAAMAAGSVAVECSTLSPDWVRELGAAADTRGVAFVEAPVTGSKVQAEGGTLRFFAGASAEAIEAARPALEAMGTEIIAMGPVGSGALVKIINNFLSGVQAAAFAEAMAMIERSGLDAEKVAGVLSTGAPGSPMVKLMARRMVARDYRPNFVPPLMAKDLDYAIASFGQQGIDLASAKAARARFADAIAYAPESDISVVVEPLRRGTVTES